MTAITAEPVDAHRDRQRSALRNLTKTEARLLTREPVPLLWGVAFPIVLLSIIGAFSHGPDKSLGGVTLVATYVPVFIAFTISTSPSRACPRCSPATVSAASSAA